MELYEASAMDSVFPLFILLIFGVIVFNVIRGIAEWERNNDQPKSSVNAKITDKSERKNTHIHYNAGDISGAHGFHTSDHTFYYVTFNIENGQVTEFCVDKREFEALHEGDKGRLFFQGTRFLGFEKQ